VLIFAIRVRELSADSVVLPVAESEERDRASRLSGRTLDEA